jgi:hypothetical protein
MIPPGPRTAANRERAAQLKAAWQSLAPDAKAMLRRMDHPTRSALLHKIAATQIAEDDS